jgi:hypothetical protein
VESCPNRAPDGLDAEALAPPLPSPTRFTIIQAKARNSSKPFPQSPPALTTFCS